MDFAALAAVFGIVSPTVYKMVDFVKFIAAKDKNAWMTQLVVWVSGIALLGILALSNLADSIPVGTQNLSDQNLFTLILIGLSGGSIASAAYDYKSSRDNKDTSATPTLIGGVVTETSV